MYTKKIPKYLYKVFSWASKRPHILTNNCTFVTGKKWKSLTPSERAPCVQEAERLRTSSDTLHRSKYGYMSPYVHNKVSVSDGCFLSHLGKLNFDEGEQ